MTRSFVPTSYSSFLVDAKRYDDMDVLRWELEKLPKTLTYKILELQRCPKCKKEFTEYPALSRNDNKTEICPECGVKEAVEAFSRNRLAKQSKVKYKSL